jgi:ribosomal protein L21E
LSRAKKKFKVGDKVCIISDKATKRDRNFVSCMKECIGKVGPVEDTTKEQIRVLGWWWNVKDIQPKKPKPARVWKKCWPFKINKR